MEIKHINSLNILPACLSVLGVSLTTTEARWRMTPVALLFTIVSAQTVWVSVLCLEAEQCLSEKCPESLWDLVLFVFTRNLTDAFMGGLQ